MLSELLHCLLQFHSLSLIFAQRFPNLSRTPIFLGSILGKSYIKNETDIKTVKFAHTCARGVAVVCIAFALAFIGGSCIYTQDTGEVCVIRNLGGSLAGSTSEAGFHIKMPWQDVVTYDVRNNILSTFMAIPTIRLMVAHMKASRYQSMISLVPVPTLIFRLTIV